MKTITKILTKTFLFSIAIGASLYIGFLYGQTATNTVDVAKAENASAIFTPKLVPTMTQVKSLLDKKFISWKATYTPPTASDLDYGLIRGYVDAFKDPYTKFFPPKEAKAFNEQVKGSFAGVGMEVGERSGLITVIAPLKDSPAQKAGIKAGDVITSIDKKSTEGLSVEEAVSFIRGELNTKVDIQVFRKTTKQTLNFSILRQEIKIPTVDTEIKNGVFVIHLYNFSAESPELFRQALVKFTESKLNYLVIDLRGNPGGYLEAAVNMASLFLKEGVTVVVEKGNKETGENNHRSKGFNTFPSTTKIAVLIDEGSASASEILAGALKDNGVAKIYGQKSFGKGSVQELVNLEDGSSIKITVATWYTPAGVNISESGITPDVELKRDEKTTYVTELDAMTKMFVKTK